MNEQSHEKPQGSRRSDHLHRHRSPSHAVGGVRVLQRHAAAVDLITGRVDQVAAAESKVAAVRRATVIHRCVNKGRLSVVIMR